MEEHQKIIRCTDAASRRVEQYFTEYYIDKFEDAYTDVVALVLEQQAKLQMNNPALPQIIQNVPNAPNVLNQPIQHPASIIGLPTQPIPTFSGSYVEWTAFDGFFTNVIGRNPNISDYQRLIYLRGACKGSALHAIENVPLEEGNFLEAMNVLRERYTKKRAIFEHTFSDFFNQRKVNVESSVQTQQLLDHSNKCIKAFSTSGISVANASPIYVGHIKSLLPAASKIYWEEHLANSTDLPTFDLFKKCMEIRIRTLKAIGEPVPLPNFSSNGATNGNNNTNGTTNNNVNNNNSNNYQRNSRQPSNRRSRSPLANKCPLACSESHPIRTCPKFLAMPINERIAAIERLRYCRNCFAFSHLAAACTSNRNCRECNARHNTLIHTDNSTGSNRRSTPYPNTRTNARQNPSVNCCLSNSSNNAIPIGNQANYNNAIPIGNNLVQDSGTSIAQPRNFCQQRFDTLPNQLIQTPVHSHDPSQNEIIMNQLPTHSTHTISSPSSFRNVLLATAMVNIQSSDNQWHRARALIDQGSEICLISDPLAQLLELPRNTSSITVQGVGTQPNKANSSVTMKIKSIYGNKPPIPVFAIVLPQLTSLLPSEKIKVDHWPHLNYLQLADPTYNEPGKIDLLLGADVFAKIICNGLRQGPEGTPIAQQTQFGWILSGEISTNNRNVLSCHTKTLDESLMKFFDIESIEDKDLRPPDEKYAVDFFKRSYKRDANGKFIVRLPFKTDNSVVLGRSRAYALGQFMQLERMFNRHPSRKLEYVKCMNEYIQAKQMQLASNSETDCRYIDNSGKEAYRSYFMPHHAVIKESSTSTKLRVVFNASQKTSNGKSLNDVL